ncbi:hypothetical protein AciPR4_1618 [Terriglobus saanensis SP1PR4]|uniref:Uncharacterized protein n=1 Tax=Terriglobus saanensis (strain ATCC BAA-1853 / DSM 23119 / SP1PR4) TaxID=401053 RepID=E8V375_TERSS|nr:hypothetical protein AciPR4_1618 [Terriglobus saanensis SP1PR4]
MLGAALIHVTVSDAFGKDCSSTVQTKELVILS